MEPKKNRMVLAIIPKGGPFSWRLGDSHAEADLNFDHYLEMASLVERGKFDIIFLADSVSVRHDRIGMERLKGSGTALYFDAVSLITALAVVTKNVGLVATASTTYNEPYHLARKFATVDHISHGRAGWNVITSGQDTEAHNFGLDEQLSNEIRYERASECLEVVRDLWDSWEDGAVVRDPKRKVFFEPEKVHELNHVGKHFKVRGPLNLSRPPQGHPLISQAGGSPAGWELAARTADVLFGKSNSLGEAQRFYGEVKGRMEKYGRMPDELKVVIEMKAIVGQTEKEAREKFRAIQECATETEGRATLGHYVPGVDFSNFEMDEPIPDLPEIDQAAKRFRIPLVKDGHRATLRDMIEAGAGNWTLVGTPGQVAETLIQWHEERGADGFNFIPHHLPGGLEDFVELVVPELQNRGAFQTEYAEGSLREKLGLIRPANRHTAAQK